MHSLFPFRAANKKEMSIEILLHDWENIKIKSVFSTIDFVEFKFFNDNELWNLWINLSIARNNFWMLQVSNKDRFQFSCTCGGQLSFFNFYRRFFTITTLFCNSFLICSSFSFSLVLTQWNDLNEMFAFYLNEDLWASNSLWSESPLRFLRLTLSLARCLSWGPNTQRFMRQNQTKISSNLSEKTFANNKLNSRKKMVRTAHKTINELKQKVNTKLKWTTETKFRRHKKKKKKNTKNTDLFLILIKSSKHVHNFKMRKKHLGWFNQHIISPLI